jgi:hypothetical protein
LATRADCGNRRFGNATGYKLDSLLKLAVRQFLR